MKNKFPLFILVAFFLMMQLFSGYGQTMDDASWNQFRGPNRNGVAPANELPDAIPTSGPELLWKKDIGQGFSEITGAEGHLYTMYSEQIDSTSGVEYLAALDNVSGAEVWRTAIDSLFFDQFGNGPRSTPAIGPENIYCFSSYGKLSACTKTDGSLLWQVDFMDAYGSTLPRWGFSSSPVLLDNTLVIEAGGTESRGFMGFDKNSGALLWARGDGEAGYSSPVLANLDGTTQVIFANKTTLFSFDAAGDTLWTFPMSMNAPMASPVIFEGNKIFVSTVRSRGFIVVEVENNKPTEVLKGGGMKNDFSSSVYHAGYIYGFDVAALQCISATTGEKIWTKRGFGKGSLILVDDKLLVLSDKGVLIQVKATPEAYTEQGRFQAVEGKAWTAPSFMDGRLYVRSLDEIACYSYR